MSSICVKWNEEKFWKLEAFSSTKFLLKLSSILKTYYRKKKSWTYWLSQALLKINLLVTMCSSSFRNDGKKGILNFSRLTRCDFLLLIFVVKRIWIDYLLQTLELNKACRYIYRCFEHKYGHNNLQWVLIAMSHRANFD